MDTVLVQLLSQYAEGGILSLLILFNVFFYRKVQAIIDEYKGKVRDLDKEISVRFTKQETKDLIAHELRVVEQVLNNVHHSLDRMDKSIDRTNGTLSEIRTALFDLTRRQNKD